jgi:gamma-glutamylcyclotransferase (GGCT)/AIG2-like uncharacterized protein YtfP
MTEISGDGAALFAYGTLMFPGVIKSVIGRVPESRSAVIEGYRRLEVAGELFPGLLEGENDRVEGIIYANISREEWERLTAFEDDFYELQEVTVDCLGRRVSAFAYIVPPSRKSVLSESAWNPDSFRENLLAGFADQGQPSIQLEGKDRDGRI